MLKIYRMVKSSRKIKKKYQAILKNGLSIAIHSVAFEKIMKMILKLEVINWLILIR